MHVMDNLSRRCLYTAIVVGFIARLMVFLLSKPWTPEGEGLQLSGSGDILSYHYLAHDLVLYGRYGGNLQADGWNIDPVIRPLGYALFIALWYWLFTPRLWVALLAQVLLATVSIWLCHRVVMRAFGKPAAIWAAWLLALWPNHILFSATLMTETVYIFFVLCFLYGYATWVSRGQLSLRLALGLGALFALTIYMRVATIYLAPWMMIILWLSNRLMNPRQRLFTVGAFGVGVLLTIMPYSLYMYNRYGTPRLTIVSEYNMLMNTIGHSIAGRAGMGDAHAQAVAGELWRELIRRLRNEGIDPVQSNPFERAPYFRQIALEHFRQNPAMVITGCLKGMARFWLWPDRVWEVARKTFQRNSLLQRGIIWIAQIYAVSFHLIWLICLLVGLRCAFKQYGHWFWLALMTALYFTVVTNAAGNDRYRMQAMIFCLPVVALGAQTFNLRHARFAIPKE
ncbi:MAG: glycosyltransferase family 39 protein [Fimbriimonadales bacterium]|nr:glycosyltransferase family 39 protein [Fimbriimonadales bacterium]